MTECTGVCVDNRLLLSDNPGPERGIDPYHDHVPGHTAAVKNLCLGDLPDRRETIPPSMKPAYSSPVGNVLVVPVKKIMWAGGTPLGEYLHVFPVVQTGNLCRGTRADPRV